ncbi:MAG: GMC family oxidoreductase [Myxococcales bacterium]
MSSQAESFDYIVVGGGSSGCVVAGELCAETRLEVALVEQGDDAEAHPETLEADGYKHAFANDDLLLDRFSTPQEHCRQHRLYLGSGRGLGGSGSINGMVYTRGAKEDYASWPRGYQYDDLAPLFQSLENKLRVRPRAGTEFTEVFVRSAEAAGFRRSANMNDGDLSGVIGYETMNYEGSARRSSYVSYVREARQRENLHLVTRALTRRVIFEGNRAVGVEIEQAGKRRVLRARREVILCAGALETPKLLMLSGVGPAAELANHGLKTVVDMPSVGENLHDHPNVTMFFMGKHEVDSYYPQLYGFHRANPDSDLPKGQSDTCYVMYPARSSLREAAMRMLPTKLPVPLYGKASKGLIRAGIAGATSLGLVQGGIARVWGCVVILGKPKSRGRLSLASRDPKLQAHIDPGYFTHPEDMETMIRGVKLGRRIAQAEPLAKWGNFPLLPLVAKTDKQIQDFIEGNLMTTFHYAGTCRMGEDKASVVDLELKVRGTRGLRVADASVVPFTPVSAMNAPSMVIGLKAARLVLAHERSLGSSNSEISGEREAWGG